VAPAACSQRDIDEVVIDLVPSEESWIDEDMPEHMLRRHHLRNAMGHRHRHHAHHHHRRNYFDSLLSEDVRGEPAKGEPAERPMYPMTHPMVGRELENMDDKMEELHGKLAEAKVGRDRVEVATERAMNDMRGGASLRREMAEGKADIFVQRRLQRALAVEAKRLKLQHDSVARHLNDLMAPQVAEKTADYNEELADLKRDQGLLQHWDEVSDEYKKVALKAIKNRNKGKEELEEAEEELAAAQKKEHKAEEFLEEKQEEVTHRVEAYKYASSRKDAAKSLVDDSQSDAEKQRHSLERTKMIYQMEMHRLEDALKMSEKRLKQRNEKVENKIKSDEDKLKDLRAEYKAWQDMQKRNTKIIASEKLASSKKQQDFSEGRTDMFKTASATASSKAEAESGYDGSDWAWGDSAEDAENINLD